MRSLKAIGATFNFVDFETKETFDVTLTKYPEVVNYMVMDSTAKVIAAGSTPREHNIDMQVNEFKALNILIEALIP